ncbi:MAG: hypothetical protein AAB548_01055 [Patescibacteria group bacterium]
MDTFKASSHRRSSWPGFVAKILLSLAGLAVIAGLILINQRFLKVSTIVCQTDNSPCPEAIRNLAESYRGRSLLVLRQRQLAREIVATGLADQVQLSVQLPGRLVISLTPPATSFYLKSIFGVSSPGLSFEGSTISGQIVAPSVELAQFVASAAGKTFRLLPGGVLDQSESETTTYLIASEISKSDYLRAAFSWLLAIAGAKLAPQTIYLLPQMLVVKVKDQPDYLFNFAADPSATLMALQRLLMAVTISQLSVIDFRYTNPILR